MDEIEHTVRRYYEVVGDLASTEEQLEGLLDPAVRVVIHPNTIEPNGSVRDRDAVLAGFRAGRTMLSAQSFDVHDVLVGGDGRAAVKATWSGTVAVELPGLAPGTELVAEVASLLTVSGGRIVGQESFDCYAPIGAGAEVEADDPAAIGEAFIAAFSAADFGAMRELLDEDLLAYVTNSEGGMDEVRGRDPYLERVEAMDLPGAEFSVTPTQAPVPVDAERVLLMVEVRARRGERHLHNFAAHLLTVSGGRITEWRMADAKPAESDRFWA